MHSANQFLQNSHLIMDLTPHYGLSAIQTINTI